MNKNKESRGIYNVTFNEKNATSIKTDLEKIEYGIAQYFSEKAILYSKGYHNIRIDSGFGAEHIKLHLNENAEGAITIAELLKLGDSIREYLKEFKEPFIEPSGRKVYEWQDKQGVRFRTVIGKVKGEGPGVPLSSLDGEIITFYSDRNLNERMKFKNPQVESVFGGRDAHTPYTQAQSLDGRLVENNISSNTSDIIPQKDSKEAQIQAMKEKVKKASEIIQSKTFNNKEIER